MTFRDLRVLLKAVGTRENLLVSMIDLRHDKGQDVPLLIKLLTEAAKLAKHNGRVGGDDENSFTDPAEGVKQADLADARRQEAGDAGRVWGEKIKEAHLLGHVAGCYLALLTGKKLSISEHLTNLSKLGHLYFVMYRRNKKKFVPHQHYHNTQTMVRSPFYSVAACKKFEIDEYYIFQDSSDRLEQLFGRVRMAQRSNRNFDAVGLADRLVGLAAVQEFLDENPRLDQGSRKLSGLVKDHINPKSWPGDYDPTNVDLQLCWKKGAQLAATACLFDANEVNFAAIAATGATLLSPFPGQGRPGVKVGLRARAAQ